MLIEEKKKEKVTCIAAFHFMKRRLKTPTVDTRRKNEDSDTLSTVFALFQVPLWSLLLYPPPPTRSLVPPLPPPPPPNCRLLPLLPPPPPLSHLPHPPSQQPPPSSPCMDPLSAAAPTPLRSTPSTPTKVR